MIIFTKHAKDRMRERGILKRESEKVLINPDRIQRENNRIIASKKINADKIEVVYVIESHNKIILTRYYI